MIGIKTNIITKPNPNLFGGGIEKYTEENPYVLRGKGKDYFRVLSPQYPASLKNGHTYTLQLKSDGILSNSVIGHYNTHKDFVVYMADDHTHYYQKFNLNGQTIELGNGAHVFTFEWTLPDVVAYVRLGTFSDGVTENVIKF